jgi:hypothetical protein
MPSLAARMCVWACARLPAFFFWAATLSMIGCAIPGPPRPTRAPPESAVGCPTFQIFEAANEGLLLDVTLSPSGLNGDPIPGLVPTALHILGVTSDDPESLQFRIGMYLDGRLASTAIHGGHVWINDTEWRADAERLLALQAVLVFPDAVGGFEEADARRCVASEVVRLAPLPDAWPTAVVEPPRVEVVGRVARVALSGVDMVADEAADQEAVWRIVRRTVKSNDGEYGHMMIVPGWRPSLSDGVFIDTQAYPGNVYAYSLAREVPWGQTRIVVMPAMAGVAP